MGNCLPKPRKEKKKGPSRKKKTDESRKTDEVLSRASDFKKVKKNEPKNMVYALNKAKQIETSSDELSEKITKRKATPRPSGSKSRNSGSKSKTIASNKKESPRVKDVEDSSKPESVVCDPVPEESFELVFKDSSDDDTDKIIEEILEVDEVNKPKDKHNLFIDAVIDVKEDSEPKQTRLTERPATQTEKKSEAMPDDELEDLMNEILEEEDAKFDEKVKAKQTVSFNVDIDDTQNVKPKPTMPARLTERLAAPSGKKSELDYTDEEEQLMAEILRDDQLNERKEKARREDIKIYDAKRKRQCLEKSRECELKQKLSSTTGDKAEKRMRVKRLAEADRKKASKNKGEGPSGGQ